MSFSSLNNTEIQIGIAILNSYITFLTAKLLEDKSRKYKPTSGTHALYLNGMENFAWGHIIQTMNAMKVISVLEFEGRI